MPLSETFCDDEEDVDSLIGRRAGSSFSSMASLIYNPAVANTITPKCEVSYKEVCIIQL